MDSAEQSNGEKRVQRVMIEPLVSRGLVRPSGVTRPVFDEMLKRLSQKLAYMSEQGLAALEEEIADRVLVGGKNRFPIANEIERWAAQIEAPTDTASPLIRNVFANEIGRVAIAEGWAPELLDQVKGIRRWPAGGVTGFVASKCREKADDHIRRLKRLDGLVSGGGELSPQDFQWRVSRQALNARCVEIRALGLGKSGGE